MSEQRDATSCESVPPPDYVIAMHGPFLVLRRMEMQRTHLVDLPRYWLTPTKWIGPAYWALHDEAVAACGVVLKPDHRGLVAMKNGTPIGCPACKRVARRVATSGRTARPLSGGCVTPRANEREDAGESAAAEFLSLLAGVDPNGRTVIEAWEWGGFSKNGVLHAVGLGLRTACGKWVEQSYDVPEHIAAESRRCKTCDRLVARFGRTPDQFSEDA